MKSKKLESAIAIFVILILFAGMPMMAVSTGFETEKLDTVTQKDIADNLDLVLIRTPIIDEAITCFDISENGDIALGFHKFARKSVCVYNSDGRFKYGYSFDTDGQFGIGWNEERIVIYLVRGDIAVLIDDNANIMEMQKIQNTFPNNSYWNHTVFKTSRTTDDADYSIRNDLGLLNLFAMSSYSKLVKKDRDGEETILYDASNSLAITIITYGIIVILFITFAIAYIVRLTRNMQAQRHSQS